MTVSDKVQHLLQGTAGQIDDYLSKLRLQRIKIHHSVLDRLRDFIHADLRCLCAISSLPDKFLLVIDDDTHLFIRSADCLRSGRPDTLQASSCIDIIELFPVLVRRNGNL